MSKKKKSVVRDSEIIVYYIGDRPDTIYKYYNKPEVGEKPYAVIEGYWLPVVDGSDKPTYHFVENMNKHPMLMDKDWLINKIIPDKSAIKEFATLDDFMEDNFLEHI